MKYKRRIVVIQLWRALVRPHVEYYVEWSSYLRKDINALETVQSSFTRLIPGTGRLSKKERLDRLGLYLLAFPRV